MGVHGWKVDGDGGNMGVENSVHSDCKGICYVFLPCNQYDDAAEEKAKAEKNALEFLQALVFRVVCLIVLHSYTHHSTTTQITKSNWYNNQYVAQCKATLY